MMNRVNNSTFAECFHKIFYKYLYDFRNIKVFSDQCSGYFRMYLPKARTFSLGVNGWNPAFKCAIDELNIFECALPPSQVAELAEVK